MNDQKKIDVEMVNRIVSGDGGILREPKPKSSKKSQQARRSTYFYAVSGLCLIMGIVLFYVSSRHNSGNGVLWLDIMGAVLVMMCCVFGGTGVVVSMSNNASARKKYKDGINCDSPWLGKEILKFNALCDHCGRMMSYPENKQGETIVCPYCRNSTFLKYQNPKDTQNPSTKPSVPPQPPSGVGALKMAGMVGLVILTVLLWIWAGDWRAVLADCTIVFVIIAGLAIYFLPTYIAVKRHHKNALAILALNLLLGWTFLGWVISLVWALKND
jgi:DNA-directed RNA polymerase subunit RPC12/RpoP